MHCPGAEVEKNEVTARSPILDDDVEKNNSINDVTSPGGVTAPSIDIARVKPNDETPADEEKKDKDERS